MSACAVGSVPDGAPAAVEFVCLATGALHGLGDRYVSRLHAMLAARCPVSFRLSCITDRPRSVPGSIRQIDCSRWRELLRPGMRPTTMKLGLFNPAYVPCAEFFYLDLSLVIRGDLAPLLEAGARSARPLVILRDWFYDSYNSSVMRIRQPDLRIVYEDFAAGVSYPQQVAGDQDFLHATIRTRGLAHLVDTFSPDLVASFKLAARTARRDRAASRAMVEKAVIVKFHGAPKLHEAVRPWNRLVKYGLRYLRHGAWGLPFSIAELDRAWKGWQPGAVAGPIGRKRSPPDQGQDPGFSGVSPR